MRHRLRPLAAASKSCKVSASPRRSAGPRKSPTCTCLPLDASEILSPPRSMSRRTQYGCARNTNPPPEVTTSTASGPMRISSPRSPCRHDACNAVATMAEWSNAKAGAKALPPSPARRRPTSHPTMPRTTSRTGGASAPAAAAGGAARRVRRTMTAPLRSCRPPHDPGCGKPLNGSSRAQGAASCIDRGQRAAARLQGRIAHRWGRSATCVTASPTDARATLKPRTTGISGLPARP